MRFVIIGAGMSGILAAIKVREAGHDFVVLEKADRVGGTWRENTYPGIACDVPSHIYSYSFALNPEWSYFASPGTEVQAYFEEVARRFELEPHMRFDDAVVDATWTGESWRVTTASGHVEEGDFLVAATGVLHHPKLPDIDGLDAFEGAMFHSARWDHDVATDGKRVGIIGTGSSGVQISGALAPTVGQLAIFQRTAQWVVPMPQVQYTEDEKQELRTNQDSLQALHERLSTAFNDGFATEILDANSGVADRFEELCHAELAKIEDADLRAHLTPDYRAGCKRLVVSHNWYDAIAHPNTSLVTEAVMQVEAGGVRTADGQLHELDVLVLATGFQVDRFMRPMRIAGRDGVLLDDVWSERPSAYLSVTVPDFPNFFMLNGPNSPVGNFSLIQTAEMQMSYVMQLVDLVGTGQLDAALVREEAAARFDAERIEAASGTVWATGCMSWYLDDRGIPFAWPFPFSRFDAEMREPKLGDYEPAR